MYENKKIFITGGTGSWGNELVSQLLTKNPKEIIIFSRGELQQVVMQRKFNNKKIKFIIGDVRDFDTLNRSMRGVNIIYHLAALKHVPICEDQPEEAIKTNIQGTINLVNAAIENNVETVIDVSTDKAVDPLNLYGMTKAIGEKIIIHANKRTDKTKFVCVRGGNVMGSNGSVIPFFIDQIKTGKIGITDYKMTRYFLTLSEAIKLLFKATESSIGGEIFVMNMPSCYIKDLAEVLIENYSKDQQIKTFEIGIRPGEKLDEVLISKHESPNSFVYNKDYFIILPSIDIDNIHSIYNNYKLQRVNFSEFSSKTTIMNKNEIQLMLKNGGFLG